MTPDERAEVRRWSAARRAGAERERDEARGRPPDPETSLARALSLIDLCAALWGERRPEDPVSRREDELGWDRWARLRRRLGAR
jgi:hypothetical protein